MIPAPANAAKGIHSILTVNALLSSLKNAKNPTTATAAPPVIPKISGDANGLRISLAEFHLQQPMKSLP